MINLIPLSAQKKVKREYWLRVASVWAIAAGAGLIVITILTLPVYLLVTLQLENQAADVTTATAEQAEFTQLEAVLEKANQQAKTVILQQSSLSLTEHINIINNLSDTGIDVTSFRLDINKATEEVEASEKIVISGNADSRLQLSNFRDAIEQHEFYEQVDLPFSALIKDRDIDFSLSLIVSEPSES